MPTPPPSGGSPRPSGAGPTPTVNNHYVPKWYQKRFLPPGTSRFHYLDLRPDRVEAGPGQFYRRDALKNWGPAKCFARDHLYTVKLGAWATDAIEHRFFGPIDNAGRTAAEFFADYDVKAGADTAFRSLLYFMDAQRFRTPRGLAYFATLTNVRSHNALLLAMQRVFQQNATMWTEGVWEIVSAANSPTKFLLTDNPVTFYNAKAFPGPGSPYCTYPRDALLRWMGTRTIFPLGLDKCLIITHLGYTRNPWVNALSDRVNARSYASAMFNMLHVQTQRQLDEDEVRRINFILKKRADRYIAAVEKEWLYPEQTASATLWSKLDHDWFLLPNLFELHLGGTVLVGYKNGSSAGWDEYGRAREHPNFEKKQQDEWANHDLARGEWGAKRFGKSIGLAHEFHHRGRQRPEWDEYMRDEVARHLARPRPRHIGKLTPNDARPAASKERDVE